MLKLGTIDETIAFARFALDLPGTNVVTAQKPSGKFVAARQLSSDASGVTYNRDGEFEQEWEAKAGDWLVTACDADGVEFIADGDDGRKHVNSWPMSDETFRERYEVPDVVEGRLVVEAKSVPQRFLMLDEAALVPSDGVSVHQSWGSDEVMAQGAALNIEGLYDGSNDVYAVDPTFFAENYEVIADESPSFPSLSDLRARAAAERSADKDLGEVSSGVLPDAPGSSFELE